MSIEGRSRVDRGSIEGRSSVDRGSIEVSIATIDRHSIAGVSSKAQIICYVNSYTTPMAVSVSFNFQLSTLLNTLNLHFTSILTRKIA